MANKRAEDAVGAGRTPHLRVFGSVGVEVDGVPIPIGGARQRRLLALLVVREGTVVDLDWLAENLWDDTDRPDMAEPSLRTYLSRLRHALPEAARDWIRTEPGGYRLSAPPEAIEHRRFSALRQEATAARGRPDPAAALDALSEALALWRGTPFRELEDLGWVRGTIEQLQLDRLEMHEERWEAALALGRHTQITGELAGFVAEHGLRDRAVRQYALALHRSGRTAEALRSLDEHRSVLADETGLEPSAALVELEEALLSGEASVASPGGAPVRGYRLLEEAGAGAFSIVWRAIQPSVDREVAIKVIRPELAARPEFIRRFEAEAHLVARIEHPHIVPLIDYWREPDGAYLVMRWLRGGTLERRLDEGSLGLDEVLRLANQLGGALGAAHRHGIVHRDVKAANVVFDETGNAFLGDFGIALESEESAGPLAALSPGSPAYSSPEQIRREPLGAHSDVFSLAVVLFECLAGRLPFHDADSAGELVRRQLEEDAPRISTIRPDVPPAVDAALAAAMAKRIEDRPGSVGEFLEALRAGDDTGETAAHVVPVEMDNPYKGLHAFDDADTDAFFGRDRLVSELVDRLGGSGPASRCVVLVGPSGSGKSSVARAGLVPALRSGAVDGSQSWFVTTMTPGADPFEALESALLRIAVNPPDSLLTQLRDGNRGLLRSARRCVGSDDQRLLLVIDQLEELFTGRDPAEATRFLDAVATAVSDPASPLRVAATLRADYYDRPLGHPSFAPVLKDAAVDITPLAPDELELAMVEPARRLGVEFEPGLVAIMAADTLGQPAPLPLLQYALRELFARRSDARMTIAAYRSLGGISGALAATAERIHEEGTPAQRDALRRVFGGLTSVATVSSDLRRRALVSDLGQDPDTRWALDRLAVARLVTFDRDTVTREPTVEVAHEALLREWPRLVRWLEDDRAMLESVTTIAAAATNWDAAGRDDADLARAARLATALAIRSAAPQRLRPVDHDFVDASAAAADAERGAERDRVRRLRRFAVVAAVGLVLASIAGGVAFWQREDAQRAQERAELATIISRSAALGDEDPDLSLLLALEAHRRSPTRAAELAVLSALRPAVTLNRIASQGPFVDLEGPCDPVRHTNSDGTAVFAVIDGQLASRDPVTGAVQEFGAPPEECVIWMRDADADRRWASTFDGRIMWFGSANGAWEGPVRFDRPLGILKSSFRPTGNLVFITESETGIVTVRLVDDRTGDFVGDVIGGGDVYLGVKVSSDGSLVAVSFGVAPGAGNDGLIVVADGATGEELLRIPSAFGAQRLAIDEEAGQLIAGMADGTITAFDLATGDVVSTVSTTTTSAYLDLAVRDDGVIIAVSESQVELVDRLLGPTGERVDLRGVDDVRVRPDGTLWAGVGDQRDDVLDLSFGASALVDRTVSIDPFARVQFGGGRAVVVTPPAGTATSIDLETGERSSAAHGESAEVVAVFPGADGDWVVTADGALSLFVGDRMVAEGQVRGRPISVHRSGDRFGIVTQFPAGGLEVFVVAVTGGVSVVEQRFGVRPGTQIAVPGVDGQIHVIEVDGEVFTFDRTGAPIDRVGTGLRTITSAALEPATGQLALAGRGGGVVIVDGGAVDRLPNTDATANVGFARDGELLVITGFDGTVRLWDVGRGESAGLVWDGSGASEGSATWYDPDSDAVWAAAGGDIIRVPVDPDVWVERACELSTRTLTQAEWDRLVPGGGDVIAACGGGARGEPGVTGEPAGFAVEIVSLGDFMRIPVSGDFEVTEGAGPLGCRSGTYVELENDGFGNLVERYTCEDGGREGSFTVAWRAVPGAAGEGDVNGPFEVIAVTGDFEGLMGAGRFSGVGNFDFTEGTGTLTGTFRFDS